MNNKKYNILWIDDEHHKLGALIRSAKDFGIQLIPYKSLDGGMSELEKNYPYYDGVLLDAKFLESEGDVAGTEDTYYSIRAKERIALLPKKFEISILTGQAEAFDDKTFNKVFTNVYRKGIDEDEDRLFKDLVKAANRQKDTQIRHRYCRVFEVCSEKYIGEYAGQDLLTILKNVDDINVEQYFNLVRKIVEDLFTAFNKFGLLPDEFINPKVALNETSRFLQGKDHKGEFQVVKGYTHKEETHLPELISSNLWSILNIVQDASHRALIDKHVKELKTSYLLQSVVFNLLDIIIWFKLYVDTQPLTENWDNENSSDSIGQRLQGGEVINYNSQKGFAFFKPLDGSDNVFIPPNIVSNNQLVEGMLVNVEVEEYKDNRTQELKLRVKKTERI